jgi:hypothetical protein
VETSIRGNLTASSDECTGSRIVSYYHTPFPAAGQPEGVDGVLTLRPWRYRSRIRENSGESPTVLCPNSHESGYKTMLARQAGDDVHGVAIQRA